MAKNKRVSIPHRYGTTILSWMQRHRRKKVSIPHRYGTTRLACTARPRMGMKESGLFQSLIGTVLHGEALLLKLSERWFQSLIGTVLHHGKGS